MLACLADLAAAEGLPDRGVRLAGAAAAPRELRGGPLAALLQARLDRMVERASQGLEGAAQAAAWAEGGAMPLEQTIDYALADDPPLPPGRPDHGAR